MAIGIEIRSGVDRCSGVVIVVTVVCGRTTSFEIGLSELRPQEGRTRIGARTRLDESHTQK